MRISVRPKKTNETRLFPSPPCKRNETYMTNVCHQATDAPAPKRE